MNKDRFYRDYILTLIKQMKSSYILTIAALLTFLLTSCQNKPMKEQYQWLGTLSAPKEYPVNVYDGAIIAEDFTYSFSDIWGICNPGWGSEGGVMSVSTEKMSVPDSLTFTWYSIIENKFYTGAWALPKEKMALLFREGFIADSFTGFRKETYRTIIIGLAPKGMLVVWLSGAGHQVEIGRFQAQETRITKEEAYEDFYYVFDSDYIEYIKETRIIGKPEIRKKIEEEGWPSPQIYEAYRKKYNWKPVFFLPQESKQEDFGVGMYNGEMEDYYEQELSQTNQYKERAVPKRCGFYWLYNNEQYGVRVLAFDEKEIRSAFAQMPENENIDLVFRVNQKADGIIISLKSKEKEIELKKSKVSVFKSI